MSSCGQLSSTDLEFFSRCFRLAQVPIPAAFVAYLRPGGAEITSRTAQREASAAAMGEAWDKLRRLDAFGKVNEDFFTRTMAGGVITVVSSLIMAILFFSELRKCHIQTWAPQWFICCFVLSSLLTRRVASAGLFLTVRTESHLSVDTSRGEKLQINVSRTHGRVGHPRVGTHCASNCQGA